MHIDGRLYAVIRTVRLFDGTPTAHDGLDLFPDEAAAQGYCDSLIADGTPERDLEIVGFAGAREMAVTV